MFSPEADFFKQIPTDPGVYIMKGAKEKVIYVGKANNLRQRVRQYFSKGGDERYFVASGLLAKKLKSIDTVVVANEKEALLLENHLIKEHQPKFNVNLRDDKQYLVLRIDTKKKYPRLQAVRNIRKDGAKYFGPYHSASSCRETMRTINKHFQLRTCTDHVLATRKRVCLQYQIGRCCGPCVHDVPAAEYQEEISAVSDFLRGNQKALQKTLSARMKKLSEEEAFESAAKVRDSLQALERVLDKQMVVQANAIDQDIFAYHRIGASIHLAVLFVRNGKLMGRRVVHHKNDEFDDKEILGDFLTRHYDSGAFVPKEILLTHKLSNAESIQEWLTEISKRKVALLVPERGDKVRLLEMAQQNAKSAASTHVSDRSDTETKLEQIRDRLSLSRIPRLIECFDIAHVQGTDTVASRVVFRDGKPDKKRYKRYNIKNDQNDDYASMYEVITRRMTRALNAEEGSDWEMPDLLIVDGGKGQLGSAIAALDDLGIDHESESGTNVVALAKERKNRHAPERVFRPKVKDAYVLRKNSHELHLLTHLRDEAHRFANSFHGSKRRKRALKSELDSIAGVGPTRKRNLLLKFGSVEGIRNASVVEVASTPGVPLAIAQLVVETLNKQSS